jgi:dGTPase
MGIEDGFEGNAQSFRIVTNLVARDARSPGLDLCRATLNAILKYPWMWSSEKHKWGAYQSEEDDFRFARASAADDQRSFEAEIMDWADDVTYAVHDMEDFFRAGLIPLDRLVGPAGEDARTEFVASVFDRRSFDAGWDGHAVGRDRLREALDRALVSLAPAIDRPFRGSHPERARLRSFTSGLIGRYINQGLTVGAGRIEREREPGDEVTILKELTWHYVITDPRLAHRQRGHVEIIGTLFEFYSDQVTRPQPGVPPGYLGTLLTSTTPEQRIRVAADIVAGMSEAHAVRLHRQLTGIELDPLVDSIW